MTRTLLSLGMVLMVSTTAAAQWEPHPVPGLPRTTAGKIDLRAPAPRTPDARPDFSGVWQADANPKIVQDGTEVEPVPHFMLDITQNLKLDQVPFRREAEAIYTERRATNSKDDPLAACLPAGVPRLASLPIPLKIVQTPTLIVTLHEYNSSFRQIFLDGRRHPSDPLPTFNGYSIGSWEGDTLVVDTVGFNDRTWLDVFGHPHTDQMRVIERMRRVDVGRLEIAMTITDPGAYTQPLSITHNLHLVPDEELMDYICAENEKDRARLIGK
jgi:hypothetical protein